MNESALALLQAARIAEKEQTLFYRTLSAEAEKRESDADVEALNGLLADEQHHLSRLSVRLVELGALPAGLDVRAPVCDYDAWRKEARKREGGEIARYEKLLREELDADTAAMIRGFLKVEKKHEKNLGGKYTDA